MLAHSYFQWLCDRVGHRDYSNLLAKLANTNYIWIFELDRNRAEGGLALRTEYSIETGVYQSDVADGPCSCLEMMVQYASRMVEQSGIGTEANFFDDFLFNSGLIQFDDRHWSEATVDKVIYIWLNRLYQPNGQGNLLCTSEDIDFRRLDTWEQLAIYINERHPIEG